MWEKDTEVGEDKFEENGCLYICATPIGNLGDITLRVLDCLKSVDFIAAEDTRHTRKLLTHYNIKTPIYSYHKFSKSSKKEEILNRITRGAKAALVSDAGLPAFNDPGEELVSLALSRQIPVSVLPGPSSVLTALILSGFSTVPFSFLGFLEKKGPRRQAQLDEITSHNKTTVFFETPHRLMATLKDLQPLLGRREIAVARELTKKFEEVIRGNAHYLIECFTQKERLRGEFTLVVAPAEEKEKNSLPQELEAHILKGGAELGLLLAQGYRKKEAATIVADRFKLAKKDLYQLSLQLDDEKTIPPFS